MPVPAVLPMRAACSAAIVLCFLASAQADDAVVTADMAEIKSGQQIVARAGKGQRFTIKQTNGEWWLVEVNDGGGVKTGWLHSSQARKERSQNLQIPPATALRANDLSDRANALIKQGKPREAVPLMQELLQVFREVYGPKHPQTGVVMNNLGLTLLEAGDYPAARQHFEEALAMQREISGDKSVETMSAMANLADVLGRMGDLAAARQLHEQTLAIKREVLGDRHTSTIISLNNLAAVLHRLGDNDGAKKHLLQALHLRRQVSGENHPDTGTAVLNLGVIMQNGGDFAAARRNFEQALAIAIAARGEKHPSVALALNNLGGLHNLIGERTTALSYYQRSLGIYREMLGAEHPETAQSLNNIAAVLMELEKYDSSRQHYEQALAIYQKTLGPKHARTAMALANLGVLLHRQDDLEGARDYYEQALAIRTSTLGEKHEDTARSLANLGYLYLMQGDHAKAQDHFDRSTAMFRELLGDEHPQTTFNTHNAALARAAAGDWLQAASQIDQARRGTRRYAMELLPNLSAREQITYLAQNDERLLHGALTVGWSQRNDARLVELSAAWLLNGKSMTQEALAQRELLARDAQDASMSAIVAQLQDVRRQLAAAALAAPKPGQEAAARERITKLESQADALGRQIAQTKGTTYQTDPWVEISSVRQAISADSVLVEIARFKVRHFSARQNDQLWQPQRYAAWIIPPAGQGDVKLIDLGEAEPIDNAAQAARAGLLTAIGTADHPGLIVDEGEAAAEAALKKPLEQLSRLVLKPILKEVGERRRLILSPDGPLWLTPWAALPLEDGRYAIEDYQIRYVVSGRSLIQASSSAGQESPPVIMADPNYDLGPKESEAATRAVLRTAQTAGSALRSAEPIASSAGLPKVARLPGTAAEAKAVLPKLQTLAGSAPLLYTDQWALEGVFKAVKQPKALVMSTHGFFLPDQQAASEESPGGRGGLSDEGKPLENPLLRCGLLLAGCNARDASGSGEDGVLSGMEILGTDLRGTELVVLSACETGLGQVRNGEGVAGLRQAFQLAGAQAVVSTLWQIPDQESAQLMTGFFTNLAEGQAKADALRNAQLALIKVRREQHGAAHPFFWAAFTITGR